MLFALVSQAVTPKRFSGLFGAAPAVALAGLTIVILDKGAHDAHQNSTGMIAGCAGMVAYAVAVVPLLRHMRALHAAGVGLAAWFLVAAAAAGPVFLG